MIEQSLMNYLLSITALNNMVKGAIYYSKAPGDAKLPYILITNSGGMPLKMTQGGATDPGKTLTKDVLSLYVIAKDQFSAKDIADRIVKALHNYRGDLGSEFDTWIRCGTNRDLQGWNGQAKQLVTVYADYVTVTNVPS